MSSAVLRHFRLLQPEFLGCAKLKGSARGDVTHVFRFVFVVLWCAVVFGCYDVGIVGILCRLIEVKAYHFITVV